MTFLFQYAVAFSNSDELLCLAVKIIKFHIDRFVPQFPVIVHLRCSVFSGITGVVPLQYRND